MSLIQIIVWASYAISLYLVVYWMLTFFEEQPRIRKEYTEKIVLQRYPYVSVIVPAYNEEETIAKTLSSLVALKYPADKLEIVVVDDGSKDKTSELVSSFIAQHKGRHTLRLITQKNRGKAAAMNAALRSIRGELFACLDADSFVKPDALVHMVYWHEQHPGVAIATPIMKVASPKTWVQKFQRIEYMGGMLLNKLMSYMDANYVAPGPFSVYKTNIIRKLGGFDEDNLVEDQEIAYRAQKHHYRIIQVPHAVVETVAPHSVRGLRKQRNRWYKGSLLNIIKYRSLMFRKRYGYFGMFQMPLNALAFGLGIISLVTFGYFFIRPIVQQVRRYWLINFDIWPLLREWSLSLDLLRLQITPMFILYVMLALSVVFLFVSSRTNNDRVRAYGTLYLIPYFFVYFIVLSVVILQVLVEVAVGKKQKW